MARYIDADALESALNNGRLEEQTGRAVPFNAGVAFALTMVEYAPTIDAVPRWIPCEERLPENESEVLVTDGDGHIRHALYNAVWDRFGTYEESMTIRAIAWMPLPKPYRG